MKSVLFKEKQKKQSRKMAMVRETTIPGEMMIRPTTTIAVAIAKGTTMPKETTLRAMMMRPMMTTT